MNRSLSTRKKTGSDNGKRSGFSLSSLRNGGQSDMSRCIVRLIKTENQLVNAHESAARERTAIASQLSEWGEHTGDDAISDLSDKIGVVLSEMGEQEEIYAHHLDDSRGMLKVIRNTEKSIQPTRDNKAKVLDEIQKIKMKDPNSPRLATLEQELVRSEAENLVADAQLSNITRQKFKDAYDQEFAAAIERAEKQIILAKHGRRLLALLDDSATVPGAKRPEYEHSQQARQILNDAEDDLRDWTPEPVDSEVGGAVQQEPMAENQTGRTMRTSSIDEEDELELHHGGETPVRMSGARPVGQTV